MQSVQRTSGELAVKTTARAISATRVHAMARPASACVQQVGGEAHVEKLASLPTTGRGVKVCVPATMAASVIT